MRPRASLAPIICTAQVLSLAAVIASSGHTVADTVSDFYEEEAATHVEPCLVCHTGKGVAISSGARLVLVDSGATDQHTRNARAFSDFLALPDVDAALILAKISGGAGHGGGRVHPVNSAGYKAIEELLTLISGNHPGDTDTNAGEFWDGLVLEPRERTLRRAAILMGGRLPGKKEIAKARKSEAGLRATVLKAMRGPEFHKFILTGANDRLHTEAFNRDMAFEFDAYTFFPAANQFHLDLPRDCLQNEDEQTRLTTLHRCNHNVWYQFGIVRAPLELIANVIEKNQSYKKILTAKKTMVNDFTNLAFHSGAKLPVPSTTPGEFNPADSLVFKSGVNRGQVLVDEDYETDDCPNGFCTILQHGEFITQPHAGILTEPAWLARYPTTDTNRNRARARWTYYHFLGIDIEKSAPRTTDPDALADNDNPTMKNPACTVCHQRLDPVAGTYQNYSDFGVFRERWGGMDSLADSYKFPENYGGEPGDTPYVWGDTWYRDMRPPGVNGKTTSKQWGSVRWLANQIVEDPRFAKATVAFWWPAIMGAEVLDAPAEESDPDYEQKLNAYNAQQAMIDRLAEQFRGHKYRAKQLFTDMVMSNWFRAEGFENTDLGARSVELATVGSGRLLTPEELDRKTYAIFGVRWGQANVDPWSPEGFSPLSRGDERIAYGGIDSVGVLDRNRSMTALMSNVAERQAIEFACRAVIYDFNREELAPVRKQCKKDPWYESDWEKRHCGLALPEQRPTLFDMVSKSDVPDARGRQKIENQIISMYERIIGKPLKRGDREFTELYNLLESRWREHRDRGWVDNNCWLGSRHINHWPWEPEQYDPEGMVASWSSVVRALMTHYWYLHD